MGRRKSFDIGKAFKDVGNTIVHAVKNPSLATVVAAVASVSPVVIIAKELPDIVKTVAPVAGEVVKDVGKVVKDVSKEIKGVVKDVSSFGSGLFTGMIPYVVGGVVLYFVLTSRR